MIPPAIRYFLWKRLGLLLAIASSGLLLFLVFSPPMGKKARNHILADSGGVITKVACTVNSARRSPLRNAQLVSDIINALPSRVEVVLMVNDRAAFEVASNPWPERVSFLELPMESTLTIWPQDPFVVLKGQTGETTLLTSDRFERADDRLAGPALANHFDLQADQSGLHFEGGNIVADGSHVFVGANTIRYNALLQGKADQEIARQLEREFGRPLMVVGPLPQPVAHIDMMLTPLGDKVLALADPAWGARLAAQELAETPARVEDFETLCMTEFFGHPTIRELHDLEGNVIRPPEVIGRTVAAIEDSKAIAPALDRLAQEFEKQGYTVHRMPFLFTAPLEGTGEDDTPDGESDRPAQYKPEYPCLTYNNVLLEEEGGKKTVFLPQYGWEKFDTAGRKTWAKMGYHVQPVPGFVVSSMYGGSLRCCVKVVARQE